MKKLFKITLIITACIFLFLAGCKYDQPHEISVITDAWFNSTYDAGEICNICLEKVIPNLNSVGPYKKATLYEFKFREEDYRAKIAFCLVVKYSADNYDLEKEKALQSYELQGEVIKGDNEKYLLPFIEADISAYTVNVMKDLSTIFQPVNAKCSFPNAIGLVAYSDTKMQIRYCLIYNPSLDCFDGESDMIRYIRINIPLGWGW